VLRRLRWLRRLAGDKATPRELLLAWFARGEGWPMRNFEGLASATEREWIEKLKAVSLGEATLAERADLPDWLAERLLRSFDEEGVLALAQGLNRPAPLHLRAGVPQLCPLPQGVGCAVRDENLGVQDARAVGVIMLQTLAVVLDALGCPIGGGGNGTAPRAAGDHLCGEMIDRHRSG